MTLVINYINIYKQSVAAQFWQDALAKQPWDIHHSLYFKLSRGFPNVNAVLSQNALLKLNPRKKYKPITQIKAATLIVVRAVESHLCPPLSIVKCSDP